MSGKGRFKHPQDTSCILWPEYSAQLHDREPGLFHFRSLRAGGWYRISQETIDAVEANRWLQNPYVAKRLTTHLIDQWLLDKGITLLTLDLFQEAERRAHLPVRKRAERLLRYLSHETITIGEHVHLKKVTGHTASVARRHDPTLSALAWSESEDWAEVEYLLRYLESRGWVYFVRDDLSTVDLIVTVDGYTEISEAETGSDPAQCFVAMWFDPSMDEAYEMGIRPAVESSGYKPLRIDRKEDLLDKIDDAIIAEIRRSRFIVADFTHGDDGARGGVYYEAGFAQGLGIPVIFLCRREGLDELHFDTRQFSHIDWTTPDELRERLKNRILASLGEGPELTRYQE